MEFSFNYYHLLQSQSLWLLPLLAIGSLQFLNILISFFTWIYRHFLRPSKNLKNYGSWALITGPTDGIGKAFAFQLARNGLNLILVGRNPKKLKEISDTLMVEYKYNQLQIKTVVVDFSCGINDGLDMIKSAIDGLKVGILINNVGMSYPYARYFHEVDQQMLENIIKVNIEGTTKVTRAVLPGMLERRRGAIVNIGSAGAVFFPSEPLYTVYIATKSFIDQFSRCLHVEYKGFGIDVQCQVPLYVATKMASIRRSSFFVPSADGYARAALRSIGYESRCTPIWQHSLYWGFAKSLPESLVHVWRLRFGLEIRKRGRIKEEARNNKKN